MGKNVFTAVLIAIVMSVTAFYFYSASLSKPKFDETLKHELASEIVIAPIEDAVTLTKTEAGQVLLVISADERAVQAIVLSSEFSDGVDAYEALGHKGLGELANTQESSRFSWDELAVPVTFSDDVVAAGTNYRAHAEEVNMESGPFLFPKLSDASKWNADVSLGTRLDYEVELCAVALTDVYAETDRATDAELGYLLCGDFTDRWLLASNIDFDKEMGKTGFPEGKGGNSRLPVGALLVIPSSDEFYEKIELKLYVNNQLRQRSKAGLMVWNPKTIIEKSLADCRSTYLNGDERLKLLPNCEKLPAKTLVLTGTPEGVLFNVLTLWNSGFYLGRGDEVEAYGTYLGITKNTIRQNEIQ